MTQTMTRATEKREIIEVASLVEGSQREDGAWKVRIISEGKGSSGVYTRELLESYHQAFNDVLSFKNHPDRWDGPESRDFTMIAGEILGETWVENDERGLASVAGWYLPAAEHREKLEQYRKKLGVSIFINGEGYVREDGEFEITWFDEHDPYASLDVVIAAGARGKFLESARKAYALRAENASAVPADSTTEEEGMSEMAEKDVLDAVAKITAAVEALTESNQKQAQATVDADAVEAAVKTRMASYAEAQVAIEAAKLLPSQVKSLEAAALAGADITSAIEDAKAVATEAREAAKPGTAQATQPTQTTESAQFSDNAGGADGYTFTSFGGK